MKHWAPQYIGIPFVPGGRDRNGVDCWGLVYLFYREQKGIELPLLPGADWKDSQKVADQVAPYWKPLERPQDGCLVVMSLKTVPHHVGLFADTDGGWILHCWEGRSVVAEKERNLAVRGFRILGYYGLRDRSTESV